ncbi:hypothetical protein DENSPDRAFT_885734 [Dentipellis sp. KUC8613]|nr:hypothetical protein DENSPDRAFT_885734 [Dentipellis sp. KUC8613]
MRAVLSRAPLFLPLHLRFCVRSPSARCPSRPPFPLALSTPFHIVRSAPPRVVPPALSHLAPTPSVCVTPPSRVPRNCCALSGPPLHPLAPRGAPLPRSGAPWRCITPRCTLSAPWQPSSVLPHRAHAPRHAV